MFKKKKPILFVLSMLALVALLVACKKEPVEEEKEKEVSKVQQEKEDIKEKKEAMKEEKKEKETKEISLEKWDGNWRNMTSFLEEDALKETVDTIAKKKQMSSEEYIKEEIEESLPYQALKINGKESTIAFLEKHDDKAVPVPYAFKESKELEHAGNSLLWHVFEAKGEAKYPFLLLMEIHGEEHLAHFHMRAGESVEELLNKDHWYPTFLSEDVPLTMIAEELEEHADAHDHDHKHE